MRREKEKMKKDREEKDRREEKKRRAGEKEKEKRKMKTKMMMKRKNTSQRSELFSSLQRIMEQTVDIPVPQAGWWANRWSPRFSSRTEFNCSAGTHF